MLLFQSHPEVIEAGKQALDKYGAGLSSVRFICGTQAGSSLLHKVIHICIKLETVEKERRNFRGKEKDKGGGTSHTPLIRLFLLLLIHTSV